jgi:hypothetical protein
MMILPRQARDKHRENSKINAFCNNRNVCLRGEGRRGSNPARVLAVAQIALPRRGAGWVYDPDSSPWDKKRFERSSWSV